MSDNLAALLRVMAVTDDRLLADRDLAAVCQSAVRGGATSVQVRLKERSPRELVELARSVVAAVPVPVLVNDRVDVALAAGAAGVHLGADDLPAARVRAVVPADFIVGASAGSAEEAAGAAGADYWGVGPWRATVTKRDAGPALGRDGFRAIVALARGRPCVAIGAVRPEDVPVALAAGAAGVAVVSGIFGGREVEAATRRYASSFPR